MPINIEEYTDIIADFETFIKFCSEVRPKLTKSREYINRKVLHELNQALRMPAKDVNPRIDQQYYLPIHFYYNLALVSGLFEIDRSKKTAFYFTPKQEKIRTYLDLSSNSQYLFLIKTYWVHCDWEEMVGNDNGRISLSSVERLTKAMAKSEVQKKYSREHKDKILEHANWCLNEHIIYWEILGWLKSERVMWSDTKSFFGYETIIVTELGKTFANIFDKSRHISTWNETFKENGPDILDSLFYEDEDLDIGISPLPEKPSQADVMQRINLMNQQAKEGLGVDLDLADFMRQAVQKGKQPSIEDIMNHIMDKMEDQLPEEGEIEEQSFESAFAHLFPNEGIPELSVKAKPVFIDGQYILKIGLLYESKIWRKVALNAKHTLLDLHIIIQDAFEFADDHLYAFYMDKKGRKSINDPRGDDPPFVNDYLLGDLGLAVNQRFFYLFDFGDSWEFTIDLVEIKENEKKLKTPKIIEKKGKAPEQYELYDEDEDYDEWD